MASKLVEMLMNRDGCEEDEVTNGLLWYYKEWGCADNPDKIEEMLREEFGVESDYIDDMIVLAEKHHR